MRMDDHRNSDNVEDRRGSSMGGGGVRLGGGRLGLGTIAIALVASYFLGVNPLTVINMLAGGGMPAIEQQAPAAAPPVDDPTAQFVSKVLASTEDTWNTAFREMGRQYQEPKLVLFSGLTPTACGTGQSAMGPFYCPGDQKVYIDLSFFREMKEKFRAPGEFAQAYVVAHEVGHHVQHQMGTLDKVNSLRGRISQTQHNALQVRVELQADCFAGVWAHHAENQRKILEQGDIEKAMNTAAKIGDDALQKRSQGYVVPDSFTHGSSAQRVRWFTTGLKTGSIQACDTFNAQTL